MSLTKDAKATFLAVVKGDASQAVTEFKRLGNSVEKSTLQAGGATSRFQALTQNAMGEIKANAGLMAGAAAASVAAFAWSAANSAEQLGLQIGKLRDATGLSADAASRWTEVGKDMGLQTDQIAGLIEKMTKNLGATPDKFAAMGIEVQHAKDGTVDMNATLLLAIDRMNAIQDPTKRAAAMQALFGKSWTDAAELVAAGADNVKKRLDGVQSGKVFSDSQIDDARKMRDALDDLKDRFEALVLKIGKAVIPALTTVANAVGDIADFAGSANGAIKGLSGGFLDLTDVLLGVIAPQLEVIRLLDKMGGFSGTSLATSDAVREVASAFEQQAKDAEAANAVTATFAQGTNEAGHALHDQAAAAKLSTEEVAKLTKAQWDYYTAITAVANSQLGLEGAQQNFLSSLDKLGTTVDDATTLVNEHDQALTSAKSSALAVAAAAAKQAEDQAKANRQTFTAADSANVQIKALADLAAGLDEGSPLRKSLEGYIVQLGRIPGAINTSISIGGTATTNVNRRASGGPASGLTLVGERGAELLNLPNGSRVTSAPETNRMLRQSLVSQGSSGGTVQYITINGAQMSVDDIARALDRRAQRNGR